MHIRGKACLTHSGRRGLRGTPLDMHARSPLRLRMLDTRARLDGGSVDDGRKAKGGATPQYPVSAGRQPFLVTSQNVPGPPKTPPSGQFVPFRQGGFRRNGTPKHRAKALTAHGLREFPTARRGRRVVGAHPPAAPLKTRSFLPPTGDAQTHRISKTDDCFPRKRSVILLGNRL